MLVIQRTEAGSLRLTDRRRTGVAEGEAEARRTLYYWGYTDLSINKALAELRRAEGTLPAAQPWRVVRPGESAAETSADTTPKQSMAQPSRTRRKSTAPAPAPEPPQVTEEAPEPPKKRRRASRSKRAEAESPAAAPDAAPAAKAVETAEPPARKKARRTRAGARPAAPPAAEAASAATPPAPERSETAPAAAPKQSETAPAAIPKRKRARAATKGVTPPGTSDADPLAEALTLFAEGARRLKQLESGTLPFARAPWTELREQAERILACLQGKAPKGEDRR